MDVKKLTEDWNKVIDQTIKALKNSPRYKIKVLLNEITKKSHSSLCFNDECFCGMKEKQQAILDLLEEI